MEMKKRPNIVFLNMDECKATALNCYGNSDALTPHVDMLASEGMLFENSFTTFPKCVPARCADYPVPQYGIWLNKCGTENCNPTCTGEPGQTCILVCGQGYTPAADNRITCVAATLEWHPPMTSATNLRCIPTG